MSYVYNQLYLILTIIRKLMLTLVFIALGCVALLVFLLTKKSAKGPQVHTIQQTQSTKPKKQSLGELQIFYASQTGTAAKMASSFGDEAAENGFQPIVIDLSNLSHNEFKKNQISVFFMANTGEGEPPENCVKFMKMLNGKQELEEKTPNWSNMNYAVFGLGDTQYEHFNKIGRDTDTLLQKLGAKRIAKIGLGDANSSLQDDYIEWKGQIFQKLTQFRKSNPYDAHHLQRKISSQHVLPSNKVYLSEKDPIFANFKFCILSQPREKVIEESELDFKTKASIHGKISEIKDIIEKRQDKKNGSSLELQVVLEGQPEYDTAGNIALWPTNDPQIVKQVLDYFKLKPETYVEHDILDPKKRNKFNFISPLSIIQLLENYLDLQFRVTKGLLKKLSKFPSKSPEYFLTNSSAKTTEQYKRLSENQFCYLFKLIKEYQVEMSFEDFVELSDSVGPRLFTIASSWKAQKSVVIIASIVENGLISKHFERNPNFMKAELRKSSFTDINKWKKVIFIGAGTGFAPFRGYLQEKQLAIKEGQQAPLISLYFGCKYQNSDFIYRQQIMEWSKNGIINKLNLAFSRQTQQKVYVQTLLSKEIDQVKEFVKDPDCATYVCGSLSMGRDVTKVFEDYLISEGSSVEQAKEILTKWEKEGKLIKQLW